MNNINYIVKSDKIVTASKSNGSLINGAMVIENGKIKDIDSYSIIKKRYKGLEIFDFRSLVISPALVDCHTHVLEYAPSAVLPITKSSHLMGGVTLLLDALSSGITSLGEQICGHPKTDFTKSDYLKVIKDLPMDLIFAIATVPIGLEEILFFTGITGSKPIDRMMIANDFIIDELVRLSDYPGENIMINATPANFQEKYVPRAGEIVYTQKDLNKIVNKFHEAGKKIGTHVAGEKSISMAIEAGFDVLHHAHEITKSQIQEVKDNNISIVSTPLGGTHLTPNSPEEIVNMVSKGINLAISTDAYLPPSTKTDWLPFKDNKLVGPDSLMLISNPSMIKLRNLGLDENEILKLITLNPAKVLGKSHIFGNLEKGKDANFIVGKGIPGLEITDPKDVLKVFFRGDKVIDKDN
ncbi:MAG TPA: amidohydrolase family protein [Tissierellaceae bacterium]|nr:amidohydrolase family protein [Tissierellaceae bacterium]